VIDNRFVFATFSSGWRWLPSLMVGPTGSGWVWNVTWGHFSFTWKERQ
jgi:hypothetical protein